MIDPSFNSASSAAIAFLVTLLGVAAMGCEPVRQTTTASASLRADGHAVVRATTAGDRHHWTGEFVFGAEAPAGTYALLFSTEPPTDRKRFEIDANVLADCPYRIGANHTREYSKDPKCTIDGRGAIVDRVVLPTAAPEHRKLALGSDGNHGGWFTIVRVDGAMPSEVSISIKLVSEESDKDESAEHFEVAEES